MARPKKKIEEPIIEEKEILEEKTEAKKVCVVTEPLLNLRKSSSLTTEIIDVLKMGTKLTITSEENEFYGVKTDDGVEGYVMKEFVGVL